MLVGFSQRDEAALKVLLLALKFLLNFTINFYVFLLIVLDVLKEVRVDWAAKHFGVHLVLEHFVNIDHLTVLKEFVFSDLGFVLADQVLNFVLFGSQLVDYVAEIGVRFVKFLQLVVHVFCFFFKGQDLVLHGRNFFFQLLDLEVEHKLEFF
jgi:hypothetical protein